MQLRLCNLTKYAIKTARMLNGTFPRGDPGSQIILCIMFQTGFRQLLWNMQIKIIC